MEDFEMTRLKHLNILLEAREVIEGFCSQNNMFQDILQKDNFAKVVNSSWVVNVRMKRRRFFGRRYLGDLVIDWTQGIEGAW